MIGDEMIGNCFFPLGGQFSKNEEICKIFLIFSATFKIKEGNKGQKNKGEEQGVKSLLLTNNLSMI
jgi:hypothetical protein